MTKCNIQGELKTPLFLIFFNISFISKMYSKENKGNPSTQEIYEENRKKIF
jgi:hypothetical protein